jgi:hypothetical protein
MFAAERLESTAGAARAAAARLRHWLLHGPAQLSDGRHCGGVAGRISDGTPVYVYAEITGYFLHWLADLTHIESWEVLGDRARRAIDWTTRQFAAGRVPPTRAYLDAAQPDWRNDAVFFFDLAMLLRGLTAVAEAGIEAPPRRLLDALVVQLGKFVENDTLCAVRALYADARLPQRWSTLGGPFLVKASSRVALAEGLCELPPSLRVACVHESDRWSPMAARIPIDMLHPTLYFAEGLLLAEPGRADAIAALLARCLVLQKADGSLPESESGSPLKRGDIIAQALRVGLLLRQRGIAASPSDATLDRLAGALLARVAGDGSIVFDPEAATREPNVWCAMFAEQALRWYAEWRDNAAPARIEALV